MEVLSGLFYRAFVFGFAVLIGSIAAAIVIRVRQSHGHLKMPRGKFWWIVRAFLALAFLPFSVLVGGPSEGGAFLALFIFPLVPFAWGVALAARPIFDTLAAMSVESFS